MRLIDAGWVITNLVEVAAIHRNCSRSQNSNEAFMSHVSEHALCIYSNGHCRKKLLHFRKCKVVIVACKLCFML